MILIRTLIALSLWILPVVNPVQASILSSIIGQTSSDSLTCGPSYSPCPESAPCCYHGVCHKTSTQACSLALGCEPVHSFQLQDPSKPKPSKEEKKTTTSTTNQDDISAESRINHPQSCFPLPVCRSFKESFKNNKNLPDKKGLHKALIPKVDFTGDPDQAHWTSDFDHIVPYATIDPSRKRLVLKARRDAVRTQSGGGFGATVSSTRWNRYGTFSAKFRSGATGPGIVTAMTLSNPILGEEITIEITGQNPKKAFTDLYHHAPHDSKPSSWLLNFKTVVHMPSMEGLMIQTHRLKEMIMRKRRQYTGSTADSEVVQKVGSDINGENLSHQEHEHSLEESHDLKKSAAENDLVYKIEWTPDRIQWSVDKQILRTLTSKDLLKYRGYSIPSYPMQLQLTIWDAGYNPETEAWAGGETDYGDKGDKEYATLVEWIDISCHDSKESKRNPWPGADASKRLEQVEKEERGKKEQEEKEEKLKTEALKMKKVEPKKVTNASSAERSWIFSHAPKEHTHSQHHQQRTLLSKNESGYISRLIDWIVGLLIRWSFILVALVGSASYLTEPISVQSQQRKQYYAPAPEKESRQSQ
ncbi:hypothetical protein BGZ76_009478 [Entomortierella beljakovae]|nr:hypothetical protein BGZ76_009478 [Entomortierella beljakovae]